MRFAFPEIGEAKIGEFPMKVSADWIVNWIADINDRDDPYEGPLPHHVLRYGHYELRDVPIQDLLSTELPFDPALAVEYSTLNPDTRPPAVFDPVYREILDGNHRAQSARLRGETTVQCYVGLVETAVRDWSPGGWQ